MPKLHRCAVRLLAIGCIVFCAARARAGTLISNGGFEANGGSLTGWTVDLAAGSGGGWYLQSGNAPQFNTSVFVPSPPEGSYAAMTDGNGPGSQSLLQTFTVPLNATSVDLSFDYFLLIPDSSDFVNPDTLDYTVNGNEQARVDLLTASAGAFDMDAAVVLNLFQTDPGDPNQYSNYLTFSQDIASSVTPGGTYQLRFAEADNLGTLLFGVDDVVVTTRLSPNPVPEPGTVWMVALGIGIAAGWRRARRG